MNQTQRVTSQAIETIKSIMREKIGSVSPTDEDEDEELGNTYIQWEDNGKSFRAIGKTRKELPAGLYNFINTQNGVYFNILETSTNDLIRFEDSSVDEVMSEIDTFWESRDKYKKFDVQYKRGILMHGPPGSGKSSIIKMMIRDVVNRGGIAVDFQDPGLFRMGVSQIREIHKDKPIVCIMEDIESLLRQHSPSSILNVLDGSTSYIDNIVFIATSNYPEALEERIKDRPSRFDRVIEVGLPEAKQRERYIAHLFENAGLKRRSIKKWVKDSEGLTFPHIQEAFLSVHLYGKTYADAFERVSTMNKSLNSDSHKRNSLGKAMDALADRDREECEEDPEFIPRVNGVSVPRYRGIS